MLSSSALVVASSAGQRTSRAARRYFARRPAILYEKEGTRLLTADEVLGSLHQAIRVHSSACNLRCEYCCLDYGLASRIEPDASDINDLFRNCIKPPTLQTLRVYGTEPTLNHPALEAIERQCTSGRIKLPMLSTNGLDTDYALWLSQMGWLVSVSYDGPMGQAKRPMADGRDSTEEVRSTIRALARSLGDQTCRLWVRVTVTDWATLEDTVSDIYSVGGRYIEIAPVFEIGCGKQSGTSTGDMKTALSLLLPRWLQKGVGIFLPFTGKKHCGLAAGEAVYWVLDGASGWRPASCLVDTSLPIGDATLQERGRAQGCLLEDLKACYGEWFVQ